INTLYLDYQGAIHGFVAPSIRQTDNGFFDFEFSVKNNSDASKKYYYKIFYQNETYKNHESAGNSYNILASENFYGSWEDTKIGFKEIGYIAPKESVNINDNFRIVGNPRNEESCFFEGKNDRWKKNLRVGNYSALLVVCSEDDLNKIPSYFQFIDEQENEEFINPYFYFLYGEGNSLSNTFVQKFDDILNIKASPDLGKGIYINQWNFRQNAKYADSFNCNCGNEDKLFEEASVMQFVHHIDESSRLNNIAVIADVAGEGYSKEEYNWNAAFTRKEELISLTPQTAQYPCLSIFSDSIEKKVVLKNPASKYGDWKKENVGMITRHGFTYGKVTVKANLTKLLNDDGVWNGITNAIWLINQEGTGEEKGWNLRRPCTKSGYMETYWGGRNDNRVARVNYSEIDFEILKTTPYCPSELYNPVFESPTPNQKYIEDWNLNFPEEVLKLDKKIAVCCTNWDMACHSPKNFGSGCNEISYQGQKFLWHRWEEVYRAITEKYFIDDDDVFGKDYYYFQIDWQPDKIIWRIGPEKDKLFVVGYVDETISMIPNNQMVLIVTQEFHNTNWWPGSPYQQDNIPFPKKELVGEIYEITIE
nr:hypothetical protein [Bacteroidales bacterium]